MAPIYNQFRRLAATIIGAVFFASGILKLIDPVGAGLIVEEYMKFFQANLFVFMAKPSGIFLSLLETFTGAALISGVYRKIAAASASSLIVVFTIITFFLWLFNPPMDCGCFGEALHLTHGQTFIKNIVLLMLSVFAFLPFRDYGQVKKRKYFAFWLSASASVALSIYSLLYIPLVDFTPFNSSSALAVSKPVNEIEQEEYVMNFVYEKNGHEGSFTLDRLPDSTWTYVRTEPVKKTDNIEEDSYPSLSFRDAEGNYRDEIAADSAVIAVSAYRPDKLKLKDWEKIGLMLSDASASGYRPLLLLASETGSAERLIPQTGLAPELRLRLLQFAYYSDYKTLISLNRSNGGAVYFNDGNLIEKWALRALPGKEHLSWRKWHDSVDNMITASSKGRLAFQAFILYSLIVLFLI